MLASLKFLGNILWTHGSESPAQRVLRSLAGALAQHLRGAGCSGRPHAPPPANGPRGSRLGKFPFRFLLPPVPLLLCFSAGRLARLSTPLAPTEALLAPV